MRKLIISEKNNAAFRIAAILSEGKAKRRVAEGVPVFEFEGSDGDYSVIGLRGHIVALDYPEEYNDWKSISIPELVKIDPIKIIESSARRIAKALRKLALDCDEIIIATDYDREGELIGVESLDELSWDRSVGRARFSALTTGEIKSAFRDLVEVDFRLASAAETRRIIDLKWGAALTRFLSLATGQTGKEFLSAGRIQSPTLTLIVDREREIESFIPVSYWRILAELSQKGAKVEVFVAAHTQGKFGDKKEATEIYQRVREATTGLVKSYTSEMKEEPPPIPFNTTQFLAEISRLGITASQGMKIAEELYNNGYISYPRTDNTVYPPSLNLRNLLKALEATEFGDYARLLTSRETLKPSRGRKSTTDHPPIYPTAAAKRENLKGNRWKIYELVCRRFLATLSPSSKVEEQNAEIDISGELFVAKGRRLREPGWRKIYIYWRFEGEPIPKLISDEFLEIKRVQMKEEKTRPPTRYTQGTLIQKMEKDGLGTKSTRHEIIQKLYDRKFVHGHKIEPTPTGKAIAVALKNHADMITDKKMTAHLEQDMDMIARGELSKEDVIEESQAMLEDIVEVLEKNKNEIAADIKRALNKQKVLGKCPTCGAGEMTIIHSRGNKRFIGCSRYPECKTAFPVPAVGHIEPTDESCPTCNSPMVRAPERGRTASNICINPECAESRKISDMGKCPSCGARLRLVFSARAKRFLGCENYPSCKNTYPLPQKGGVFPTGDACEICGAPIIKIISKGRRPWILCVNPNCSSKEKAGRASNREKESS